ncbi:4-hydroxyacetophenone monooxygenase [Arthrobacter ginsengisoli]|uniref:4-hydroxyacetophenone monooxygenase n=1 Tax=Arthrobacter ginsengisoli TaxID=1356565 RepID=A0ABU1UDN4_9MICC|nr:NAD(P)/FAD-dependent oxidoreductase [Arthrobacter ginsengisoli]MDR7083297.1 4-hydroxyacetophenone monooxygenase [Arthrobacter ginsengisoli]
MNTIPKSAKVGTDRPGLGRNADLYWANEYLQITETDQELRALVDDAELPVLLAALAAALKDMSLLDPRLSPSLPPMRGTLQPHGGLDDDQVARGRELAFEGLLRLRDEEIRSVDELTEEQAAVLLDWFTGGRTSSDPNWAGQMQHELHLAPNRNGSADWSYEELSSGRNFETLIVGAGVSGIAAAYRLKEAGLPYTWIEVSHRVGGTWWKNHYPGVRLDTPTYGYSFSFAQRDDWPHQFATGEEVLEYLETVVARAGIAEDLELHTSLERAEFDEASKTWVATTRTKAGTLQTRHFNAIITCVGQLDHPHVPTWPGQQEFTGIQMHSQEWDASVDLRGKRVAVIGTGASAYQIIPAIVDEVERLHVFQRSAPWMLPAPTYHEPISDAAHWLHAKVPHYGKWFRLWVTAIGIEGRIHIATADETWHNTPLSVGANNEEFRQEIIRRMEHQYEGRPDLLEKAIPLYPPSSKRLLRDNGVWAAALMAPNADVVSTGLESFTEGGLITGDGEHLDVDVVIYATGFRPSDYLDPIEIIGRGGIEIHEYWQGDAKGFAGITVPNFPNLFMMLGPNTTGVVAGGLHIMMERAAEYAVEAIRQLLTRNVAALDLKQEALDRHIAWVDAENNRMAWGQPYVNNWYKNRFNRVSQVWPFKTTEYWRITQKVEPDDYEFLS